MKLEHIGITIRSNTDIKKFYCNLLGMKVIKNFTITNDLAWEIFGINYNPEVYLLEKDKLLFEIFVTPELFNQCFRHISISVKDRDSIIQKMKRSNYHIVRKKREKSEMIFIKDKAGNIFELIEQ